MTSMATVSLEEKRLQQLKQQLFGKSDSAPIKVSSRQLKNIATPKHEAKTISFESVNLKTDLLRIAILSTLALGIQLSLFLAIQNGFLKLF